jgi:peroxiredoxin
LLLAAAVVVVVAVAAVTIVAVTSSDNGSSSGSPSSATTGGGRDHRVTPSVDTGITAEVGGPAPNFVLNTLDGKNVSLGSLRGRPVIVNFWASWCNPCRHEFPLLKKTLRKYHADRLAVVGVSYLDIDSDARNFAEQQHATWPLALDPRSAAAHAYGVRVMPTTFFISPNGTVADRIFGQLPTGSEFQQSLDKILQAHAQS